MFRVIGTSYYCGRCLHSSRHQINCTTPSEHTLSPSARTVAVRRASICSLRQMRLMAHLCLSIALSLPCDIMLSP